MKPTYEIYICNDLGERQLYLGDFVRFTGVRSLNSVGQFMIELSGGLNQELIKVDRIVDIWRKLGGGKSKRIMTGFIRFFDFFDANETDKDSLIIAGPDLIELCSRRIVDPSPGATYYNKTDQADDLIKDVIKESLGNEAAVGRNLSSYGFSVENYIEQAPTISKSFAYRNVLDVIQEAAASSYEAGTPLYFDIIPVYQPDETIGLLFITKINYLGQDRTITTGSGNIAFGKSFGNIRNVHLSFDYRQEATYIYAGGSGDGPNRVVETASDTGRINQSIWNLREKFVDARGEDDSALAYFASAELNLSKPRTKFSATLLDVLGTEYGVDWEFGDKVSVVHHNEIYDGIIKTVRFSFDASKGETIEAKIEVEE